MKKNGIFFVLLATCFFIVTDVKCQGKDDRSGFIKLGDAAKMISNFLQHQKLGAVGKNISIGGTFDLTHVNLDTQLHKGLLLWYCVTDKQTEFYLSAEK